MKCPECGFEAYEDMFEDRDGSLNCPQCKADLIIVSTKKDRGMMLNEVDRFVRAWGEICWLVNGIIGKHVGDEAWKVSADRLQKWLDKNEDPTQFIVQIQEKDTE